MIGEDCIYSEQKATDLNLCKRTCSLNIDGKFYDLCRLQNSYIPKSSSPSEIERAAEWQDMSYDKQPDYKKLFPIKQSNKHDSTRANRCLE